MNDKMDAGPVIVQEKIAIKDDEDAEALSARLAQNGAELVLKALDAIGAGEAKFTEQDEDMATYAPRLKKENGLIDWEKSAGDIVRLVRGTQPWPGAYTYMDGKMLKVKRASIATSCDASDSPATICDINNLTVAAGEGAVWLLEVQLEGKKAMDAAEFLRGHPVKKDAFLS